MAARKRKSPAKASGAGNGSFVPDWAVDAIWYQVFPERFRNGCPASNPRPEDMDHPLPPDWRITPWGRDWYRQAAWEKRAGPFYRTVYGRRYGGDLVGLREKLDYLQDLGVSALYLNPIFMAASLHKYDGSSFHHVDPSFGPDRAGDLRALAAANETEDPATWIWTSADRCFLDLVADVHQRGMRIIIDGVFNHTGRRFFAFQDLLKHGRQSRYADWYRIEKWKRDGTFDYRGWFGHGALPELGRNSRNLVRPVREYIFNSTRRWMDPDGDGDPSDGIDGWRLDVAFCVPIGFWRDWRRCVKSINPEAYITAEIMQAAPQYLQGDTFDAVMNYAWLYPTVGFFVPSAAPLPAPEFQRRVDKVRAAYPRKANYVMQNLLDSHDAGRIASIIENGSRCDTWDAYFHISNVRKNPDYLVGKPAERSYEILRQLLVFQMTYVGAPMIYYGTEVGMWGGNDPDNRQPMLWEDIRYEAERHRPHGKEPARPTPRAPDKELFGFVRKLIALRKKQPALRRGRFRWARSGHDRLVAFWRSGGGERFLLLFNAGDEALVYPLRSAFQDAWDGRRRYRDRVEIPARGWKILRRIP